MRQKVLSPRQSYPHRSRKRAYRFTILDLPSTLLPIKSMRSSQLLSPPLLFSLLFSAICCSLSQLFSTLLYSANSCLLRIYIYILLSTLLCSAHLTSSSPVVPLFNSFRLFAHRLTSSQLFLRPFSFSHLFSSLSKLLSTLPNFSTLLNSSPPAAHYFLLSRNSCQTCYSLNGVFHGVQLHSIEVSRNGKTAHLPGRDHYGLPCRHGPNCSLR